MNNFVSREKDAFLLNIALSNTLGASLSVKNPKYPVFRSDANEMQKSKFREDLGQTIVRVSQAYKNHAVPDQAHVEAICHVADCMSQRHGPVLDRFRLRIGVTQKALNLYLKFAWTLGWMKQHPPHCPFDRKVISFLLKGQTIREVCNSCDKWTQMDCVGCYWTWVEEAKRKVSASSRYASIAEWELYWWSRNRHQWGGTIPS